MRATASEVSNMKPTEAIRLYLKTSSSRVPGGAVGCTSTGRPRWSIAFHTGGNALSGRGLPLSVASALSPTAAARDPPPPARAELLDRARQLRDGELRVLPGQRAHEPDALRVALLLRGH